MPPVRLAAVRMDLRGRAAGPARFFADHPALYRLSVLLAAGSAIVMEVRSATARGPARKAGWGLLALVEWGVVVGLLALPLDGREAAEPAAPAEP
jgi:hypothetical protein